MKIAILGWGSLIWDPRDLPREGPWERPGPWVPLEFSRVSLDCRLTLVIDRASGDDCETCYAVSPRADLDAAVEDLTMREETNRSKIGFVDLESHGTLGCEQTAQVIRAWAREHHFEGVVWTGLQPNFEERTGTPFSVDAAITYLEALPSPARACAFEYIDNAPTQISTPLRRALARE